MKVLIIGSGGREHALVHSLGKSTLVDRLFWTPGNAAADDIAENPHLPAEDLHGLLRFAKGERVELTVVGPEAPLVHGISDLFAEHGLTVFGPVAGGARIEGSKVFAKELMSGASVPTARYAEFGDRTAALEYIKKFDPPYVIKADGLAAGKGVSIVRSEHEALEVLIDLFDKKIFGESGTKVVVEEFLRGEEATVLALCDGENVVPLLSSQDHKPVGDGDTGPNTGGMGAIAPAPVASERVMGRVMERVLLPLVRELRKRGIVYKGVIYAGLMINEESPFVVEFNCRFGDPEAEAVLPLLLSDLAEAMLRTVNGGLRDYTLAWREGYACDVVLVSGGYPASYEKGEVITGLPAAGLQVPAGEGVVVYHGGTKKVDNRVVTDGGRVLNVVGMGKTLREAVDRAYRFIPKIRFEKMAYRKDIGFRGLSCFPS